MTLAVPLGILVFFAKVDTTIPSDFAQPVDFLVPGVLSLAVMAAAMVSLGIATGFERRYGVLKRLGSTPLSRGGLLAAKTATVLLFELVEALLIVVTGIALGWSPATVPALALLLIGTIACGDRLLMRDAAPRRTWLRPTLSSYPVPRGWRTRSTSARRGAGDRVAAGGGAVGHGAVGAVDPPVPDRPVVVPLAWAVPLLAAAHWFRAGSE